MGFLGSIFAHEVVDGKNFRQSLAKDTVKGLGSLLSTLAS